MHCGSVFLKSRLRDILQNIWLVVAKTVKDIKSEDGLRNLLSLVITDNGAIDGVCYPEWQSGTEKGLRGRTEDVQTRRALQFITMCRCWVSHRNERTMLMRALMPGERIDIPQTPGDLSARAWSNCVNIQWFWNKKLIFFFTRKGCQECPNMVTCEGGGWRTEAAARRPA